MTSTAPPGDSPAQPNIGRPRLWHRPVDQPDGTTGADLAAVRRGVGRDAGSVPAMWRHYATIGSSSSHPAAFRAEHLALTLFAVHQQSKSRSMHQPTIGLGRAVLRLKLSDAFSPEAVTRRFTAAATAATLGELGGHLRGLISQLRTIDQPLDYDQLERDFRGWDDPVRQATIRLTWGRHYYAAPATTEKRSNP